MIKDLSPLLARLTFGLTMLMAHGWPKLMNFEAKKDVFPDPLSLGSSLSLGLVIFAELFCAAAVSLGLFTRLAAIPLAFTMFVAFAIIHSSHPWAKMELSFIYFFGYLLCALLGSGRFSLDYVFRKKV
jgi:putative oxidoreductase